MAASMDSSGGIAPRKIHGGSDGCSDAVHSRGRLNDAGDKCFGTATSRVHAPGETAVRSPVAPVAARAAGCLPFAGFCHHLAHNRNHCVLIFLRCFFNGFVGIFAALFFGREHQAGGKDNVLLFRPAAQRPAAQIRNCQRACGFCRYSSRRANGSSERARHIRKTGEQ